MPGKQAVVAIVNSDGTVEVVYLDNKGKAIAEPVKWTGDGWTFVHKGPAGTYAENSSRFAPYAKIAKARFSRH